MAIILPITVITMTSTCSQKTSLRPHQFLELAPTTSARG